MITAWTDDAWEDYLQWQKEDQKILTSINDLIADIKRDPFRGLGKPEPLKHALQGWWSRRISSEHRLVYRVSGRTTNNNWISLNAAITTRSAKSRAARLDCLFAEPAIGRGYARPVGFWAITARCATLAHTLDSDAKICSKLN